MDDLMSRLQNVLSDKESMKQIQELAGMLTQEMQQPAGVHNDPQPSLQPQPTAQNSVPEIFSSPQGQPAQNGGSPDLSQLISNLGAMLGGSSQQAAAETAQQSGDTSGGFDMGKLLQLQGIIAQASKPDKNVEFLLALKPLLKDENKTKIDRLVKIFKLFAVYPALRESGLLGGDLFGLL